MSVNNYLFSIQNMSPAMLSVGAGKTQNYGNLSELNSLWGGADSSGSSSVSSLMGNSNKDTVSLTYKSIGQSVVTDMASVTAQAIKQYPELEKDYVIAIIDNGESREARVYKRADILENFKGTDAEKAALEKQLSANPLMVFNNANGLPETAEDKASQYLASKLNDFLKTNAKIFNTLDKAGFDPLADMLGSSTLKKILANYAQAQEKIPETPPVAESEGEDEEA